MILISPYVRAHETAKAVSKTFDLKKNQLMLSDNLSPSGFAKDLIAEINANYPVNNLMLVGHEPYLSDLIVVLVAGDPSMSILVKKVACVACR
jgi:phosphohistidine phosphatase